MAISGELKNKLRKETTMSRYLEELGLKSDNICAPATTARAKKKEDRESYAAQRAERGFDDRECWDLDITFLIWLYEHIRGYEEKANDFIDLDFYKFNIPVLNEETGEEVIAPNITQWAAMAIIKGYIKDFFFDPIDHGITDVKELSRYDEMGIKKMKLVAKIWAEILPAMWW